MDICGNDDPSLLGYTSIKLIFELATYINLLTFDILTLKAVGGDLGGRTGSFTSPAHPYEYDPNLSCDWSIEVPSGGNVLTLEFTAIGIEGTEGVCNQDYLEVYDGSSPSGRLFGRYCGMVRDFQLHFFHTPNSTYS